jgi:succinate dehydrogenase / fumarate reductase flavoprotein subunit
MQGLADGYFIAPYTVGNYLAQGGLEKVPADHAACREAEGRVNGRIEQLLGIGGKRTSTSFHRELGKIVWDACGMARNASGLADAVKKIPELREQFWEDLILPGSGSQFNAALEEAGRVADYMELAELMCRDALERNESCGGHFREEFRTEEGEARRVDEEYSYGAVWEYTGENREPVMHKEPLEFEYLKPSQRSYK